MVCDGATILRDPKELLDDKVETRKISTRKNLVVFFSWKKCIFKYTELEVFVCDWGQEHWCAVA